MTAAWTTLPFAPLDQLAAALGLDGVAEARLSVTAEGEHAVIARAMRDEVAVVLALVYGDETVDALVRPATIGLEHVSIAELQSDARAHRMKLGTRPRRFLHTPPSGWRWVGDHRTSIYEAPDGHAAIAVYPSMPEKGLDAAWRELIERLVQMGTRVTRTYPSIAIEVNDMQGTLREFDGVAANGEVGRWAFAALTDGFAAYPLLMSAPSDLDQRLDEFARVVDSITQLPRPFPITAFSHWTE